jgi:hypothetical protein
MLSPEAATETVWEESFRSTVHAAGGEGPLPGSAAGSGGGMVTPVGAAPSVPAGVDVVVVPPAAPAVPPVVPEPAAPPAAVPATGDEPVGAGDAVSADEAPAEPEVPETCGADDGAPVETPETVPAVPAPGVVTCSDGEDGAGGVTSFDPSVGAGPEVTSASEAGEIGAELPELIVCCGAGSVFDDVVWLWLVSLPWAIWSERSGVACDGADGVCAGVVWAGAAACVSGAGVCDTVEPTLTGAPTVSTTVFACENSHDDADVLDFATAGGASVYESLTTGTRLLMCFLPKWSAGRMGATAGAACSVGIVSFANET